MPWSQCVRYIPDHWWWGGIHGEGGVFEDPLEPDIWVQFHPTNLSTRLIHETNLYLRPIEDHVTAILLGLHSRVGAESSLRVLDAGSVRVILEHLWL